MAYGLVTGWADAPVFGTPPADGRAVVRPSAYGLVTGDAARLAVVRTPQGLFLPGGGIEPGEAWQQAIVREVWEECGLQVLTGCWTRRAVDFVYSSAERTHFEKRSTFVDARSSGPGTTARELDHALEWLVPESAIAALAPPSHRWAVAQWLACGAPA